MLIERPRVSRAWFMAEARINYSLWLDTARIIAVAIETFRRETIGRVGLGPRRLASPLLAFPAFNFLLFKRGCRSP